MSGAAGCGWRVSSASRPASCSRTWRATAVVVIVGLIATGALLVVPAAGTTTLLAFPSRLPSAIRIPVPGGLSNPSLGGGDPSRGGDPRDTRGRKSFGYFGFADSLDT